MSPEGKALLNIVILGLGFMVMFTAFGTCGNIEVGFRADKNLVILVYKKLFTDNHMYALVFQQTVIKKLQ